MKILTLPQQQSVSAGLVEACAFVTEEWKEEENRGDGYMMGTIGAILSAALTQELLQDAFAAAGIGILGGTAGYIIGYSLSSHANASLPNNQWHCFLA